MMYQRIRRSLAVAVLVSTMIMALPNQGIAQDQEQAGVLGTPTDAECTDTAQSAADSSVSTYTIVSEDSVVRYRAQEELASVGTAEAVGETNAIIGNILLDDTGAPATCSRFDVDLRTLTSDEARRDNYLYDNTLETGEFPLATFILTEVQNLDGSLADGEEVSITLIGNMTIHGETKLVAWDATVQLEGDTLTGVAATNFDMADFAIEEPIVGPVVSVDENIKLETEITAVLST